VLPQRGPIEGTDAVLRMPNEKATSDSSAHSEHDRCAAQMHRLWTLYRIGFNDQLKLQTFAIT
jgi:hypothetical protein